MNKNSIDNLIFGFNDILIECKTPQILIENILGYFYATLECSSIKLTTQEKSLYKLPKKTPHNQTTNILDFSYLDYTLSLCFYKQPKKEITNTLQNSMETFINQLHYLTKIENEKLNDYELMKQAKNITKAKIIAMLSKGFLTSTQNINNSATELEIKHKYKQLKDDVFIQNIRTIFDNNDEIVRNLAIFSSLMNDDDKISTFTSHYLISKIEKIFDLFFKKNKIDFITNIEKITLKTYENALLEALFTIVEHSANEIILDIDINKKIFFNWIKNKNESIITIHHAKNNKSNKHFNEGLSLYLAKNVIYKQINGIISVSNSQIDHNGTLYDGVQYTINLKENNEHY